MNTHFTAEFLQNLVRKRENRGFTLIELLVVVIMVGVLAAISLPMLLQQIAKGRQAEARATLGAMNRAQMAYRYEKTVFGQIQDLPMKIPSPGQYYSFANDGTPDATYGAQKALALPDYDNDIKNYASASGQSASGGYNAVLCEDDTPIQDNVTTANAAGVVSCVDGIDLK
ncbi:pili assembly chaperone [Aphanothece hegewaldii CCALA 016]|uniref:Pili assembly chaperone n=1 Tax=Aphanothece hegewaldii CCALA 016 TaxID=2107694 RepID=A0A2T1LTU3_9CHRO|nr:type IV pilin-like G/H family protein [Aphanothece hegewaldii]PSF34474.1 pili assembly chaperone [Aphanothece hegewaldii CCALA 016]